MLKIIAQIAAAIVTDRGKCLRLSSPDTKSKIVPFVRESSILYRIHMLLRCDMFSISKMQDGMNTL